MLLKKVHLFAAVRNNVQAIYLYALFQVILTPSDTWYEVVTVPVTLEIGTVAPTKSTINRFLNMIAEGRSGSRSSSSAGRMTVAEMQALRARRQSAMTNGDNQSESGGTSSSVPGRVRRVSSESSQADSTKSGMRKKKSGASTPERKISHSESLGGSENNEKHENKDLDEVGWVTKRSGDHTIIFVTRGAQYCDSGYAQSGYLQVFQLIGIKLGMEPNAFSCDPFHDSAGPDGCDENVCCDGDVALTMACMLKLVFIVVSILFDQHFTDTN